MDAEGATLTSPIAVRREAKKIRKTTKNTKNTKNACFVSFVRFVADQNLTRHDL